MNYQVLIFIALFAGAFGIETVTDAESLSSVPVKLTDCRFGEIDFNQLEKYG